MAFLMVTLLSISVVIAGATISFAHSSTCGSGCTVPVFLGGHCSQILTRVDCAGIVFLLSVLIVIGFGLHFCISSVSAIVICFLRKVPGRCPKLRSVFVGTLEPL